MIDTVLALAFVGAVAFPWRKPGFAHRLLKDGDARQKRILVAPCNTVAPSTWRSID
jgi:hypothetical protein